MTATTQPNTVTKSARLQTSATAPAAATKSARSAGGAKHTATPDTNSARAQKTAEPDKTPAQVAIAVDKREKIDCDGKVYFVHPAASTFPMIDGKEFDALVDDIGKNGLQTEIVMHDGMVLDGRNRLAACAKAKVAPRFTPFVGDSPTAFVMSANIIRRHLNASQRAMLAANLLPMFEAEAKARKAGKATGAAVEKGKSRDKAAAVANVSNRYVTDAKKIAKHDPALAHDVQHGKVTLQAAKKSVAAKVTAAKPSTGPKDESARFKSLAKAAYNNVVAMGKLHVAKKHEQNMRDSLDALFDAVKACKPTII